MVEISHLQRQEVFLSKRRIKGADLINAQLKIKQSSHIYVFKMCEQGKMWDGVIGVKPREEESQKQRTASVLYSSCKDTSYPGSQRLTALNVTSVRCGSSPSLRDPREISPRAIRATLAVTMLSLSHLLMTKGLSQVPVSGCAGYTTQAFCSGERNL